MLEFITTLKHRYQVNQSNQLNAKEQDCLEQLMLIEAFLQKSSLAHLSRQIAIIGPTQSGKSSIVNLILQQTVAGVSPLAGFTVHPQGFSVGQSQENLEAVRQYFSDLQQVAQAELNHTEYQSYSLTDCPDKKAPIGVVWDTPDFDSIGAQSYQYGVLKTLALADVLVLVVSKEKYADQSVWDRLLMIEPLKQPIIVVLNKLVQESESLIVASFKERWQQIRGDTLPELVSFLFIKEGLFLEQDSRIQTLLAQTKPLAQKQQAVVAKRFMQQHWEAWVAPIKQEQATRTRWQSLVDEVVADGLATYQRDYLNHPHHYDTFQNALAKLLLLLEVPGMAGVLGKSRRALTWPIRKLFSRSDKNSEITRVKTQETVVLAQISEHVLLQLSDKILEQLVSEQALQPWWKSINKALRAQRPLILHEFSAQTQVYHEAFKQEIDVTAEGLYNKLKEHPAMLNSLRATRIAADAAMLVLVLQAGGIGLHDLLIAPAMLSLTAYLAESAIGSYLHKAEAELKQRQLNAVKEQLFTQLIQETLYQLPDKMTPSSYFNISVQQLAEAEAKLKEKPHGLRLF